jgi:hypothetical protein
MPPLVEHLERSRKRTGNPYREVHEWVDDPDYRDERHDITRVLEFAGMFTEKHGEEAAQEYVHHLADDLESKFTSLAEDVQSTVHRSLIYFGAKKP